MEEAIKKSLYNQGYRFVGEHSAVKICLWCKKAIRNQDSCYKHKFYGIESWRCVQASVTLDVCNHKCSFCWRDLNYTNKSIKKLDEPKEILDGLIKAHKEVLQGFWGSENIQKSLNLLGKFERGTVRLTLAKDMNFLYPEKYAEILKNVKFKFLEVKAAMSVGYARQRMEYKQMPFHEEIKEFAKKIGDRIGWKIVDEQKD